MRIVLALIIFGFLTVSGLAERRVALVVGNNDYEHLSPLSNAVADARAVEAALERLGFEVFSEKDRDLRRMRRAIDDFEQDAAGADVALVFFAGHGFEAGGENMLMPTDAKLATLEELKSTSFPLNELQEQLSRAAKSVLIIVDACRNDPFASASGKVGRGVTLLQPPDSSGPGLGRMGEAPNTLFAFSAAPGRTAADGDGKHSPFAAALIKYLPTDGLEIRSVLTLVQQEVYDVSRGTQLPYVESALPILFFAAETTDELPERERLLLRMANIDDEIRSQVEQIAAETDISLASLYGAMISSEIASLDRDKREEKLRESATSLALAKERLRNLESSDPQVNALQKEAARQLSLGAYEAAHALLDEAHAIDEKAGEQIIESLIERLISQSKTMETKGTISVAQLDYERAIASFQKAAEALDQAREYAKTRGRKMPRQLLSKLQDVLSEMGESQRAIGILDAAGASFDRARDFAQKALAEQPSNVRLLQIVAYNTMKMGDMLYFSRKDREALDRYQESREVTEGLFDREPGILEHARNLAIINERIGSTFLRLNKVSEAARTHARSFELINIVAAKDPHDSQFRRDVGVAYNKAGQVRFEQLDFNGAIAAHRSALAIFEQLLASDSDNSKLIHDVGYSHHYMARVFAEQRADAKAFNSYSQSAEAREKLFKLDPRHNTWRWELFWTHMDLDKFETGTTVHLDRAEKLLGHIRDDSDLSEEGYSTRIAEINDRRARKSRTTNPDQ